MFVFPPLDAAKLVLIHVAPGMPPSFWWVSASILGVLALAALVDAFTMTVPDKLIFWSAVAVALMQGLCASWSVAGWHLLQGLAAGLLIWSVNFAWYCKFRNDALGMGDAKWTVLAVSCFGVTSALFAWGLGAIFASMFIGAAWVFRHKVTRVSFAPFLLLGLVIGLWWERFMG